MCFFYVNLTYVVVLRIRGVTTARFSSRFESRNIYFGNIYYLGWFFVRSFIKIHPWYYRLMSSSPEAFKGKFLHNFFPTFGNKFFFHLVRVVLLFFFVCGFYFYTRSTSLYSTYPLQLRFYAVVLNTNFLIYYFTVVYRIVIDDNELFDEVRQ